MILQLPSTCILKLISRCLSVPDTTSLPYFETFGKCLLCTTYLTSTNMPTAELEKRAQIGPTEILVFSSRLYFLETNLKFFLVLIVVVFF